MITSVLDPEAPPREDRWRRRWLITFAVAVAVLAASALLDGLIGSPARDPETVGAPASSPASAPAVQPARTPVLESASTPALPSPSATEVLLSPDVLQLPGPVPPRGSGRFAYAATRSPVFGRSGPVRRFRVAVELGSGEDVETFAAQVRSTLGDARSWIGGRVRMQMVSGAEAHDFTVYLATRETAGHVCARGGTNIRVGGVPYTSCRTRGKAIINLDRWRLSARPYLAARVPLAVYRQYVLNHEVGHELGHRHQGCPLRGRPAPVMVQQTLDLRGCVPYAWPFRGGRPYTGPPA